METVCLSEDIIDTSILPDDILRWKQIIEFLTELPLPYTENLRMSDLQILKRFIEGYTTKEIGIEFDLKPSTIQMRRKRIRYYINEILEYF